MVATLSHVPTEPPLAGHRRQAEKSVNLGEARRGVFAQLVVEHRTANGEEEKKNEDDGGFPAHGGQRLDL
jgi:hypothetical protein